MKVTEHDSEPPSKQSWDVLQARIARSQLANDACELEPEPRARPIQACTSSGARKVLAGPAPADDVDWCEVGTSCCFNMRDTPVCVRPVPLQYLTAEFVGLYLPDDWPEPGPLEAQLKAADAGE